MIILEYLLMILMVIAGLLAVYFKEEMTSIICLSLLSIFLSVLFLLYKAPDVALAEVVIGTGLSTALYMTAISQIRAGKRCLHREE
ncbi:MAG TPA: hydrogenase subunit MbhD domain-containing protein [Halanaerobiales bacterium]|nr:hydrogenase subunit MbhD domain-containing protein [Halanaerobiales bacterium]